MRFINAIIICTLTACARSDDDTYRLSYVLLSSTSAEWHSDALKSGKLDYFGEGCIFNISEDAVDKFEQIIVRGTFYESISKPGITEQDSTFVITRSDGRFISFVDPARVVNFDGSVYNLSQSSVSRIEALASRLLKDSSCPLK